MRVEAEHDAYGLFGESVSLSVSGTDEDVLNAALDSASGTWTLNYDGTGTSLGDTYEADGRTIKRVFRDMTDRTGRVWWVDVDHTIHVAPLGDGGLLASVDTATDAASVSEYTPDDIDTVVNDVTVVGTGGEKVEGSASDSASIDEYGRQPERVNVEYIRSESEANAYASELLNPEPDAAATIRVGASVGDVASPVVNQELDVTDEQGTGMNERLPIEKQVVTQGSAELQLGAGAGVNVAKFNRSEKSKSDVTEEGSVYGNDRIGNNAIDTPQLVDTAVIETKLDDLSVSLEKVQDDAIDTVKIRDEAIEAPKIFAGAVTAAKLDTDLARANRLLAGEIEAIDIQTGTLTANEIDTLDLTTEQLTITDGTDGIEFIVGGDGDLTTMEPTGDADANLGTLSNRFFTGYFDQLFSDDIGMRGSNPSITPDTDGTGELGFSGLRWDTINVQNVNEGTPEPLDGVDLSKLSGYSWRKPPEYVAQNEAPSSDERDYIYQNPNKGVELGHMTNYLLEVAKEQQSMIDDLAERVAELENA